MGGSNTCHDHEEYPSRYSKENVLDRDEAPDEGRGKSCHAVSLLLKTDTMANAMIIKSFRGA